VLDEARLQLEERPVLRHAWGLTLDENTGTVYVTGIESAALNALSSASAEMTTLPTGEIPCSIAVNENNKRLYVANYGENSVTVLDSKTQHVVATIPVGNHPKSIAIDPTRNLVFVANTHDGTVTVIDSIHNTVLATLPAGKNPYALAVVSGSNRLYVANEAESIASSVIDLSRISKATP
jgi:YVTN family beta-propeller protein